jgi:hypothetical protein
LCYGSTPYVPILGIREKNNPEDINGWFGASKESGWDGAFLYENAPFDKEKHFFKHWDVSLNSLHVLDCISLGGTAWLNEPD